MAGFSQDPLQFIRLIADNLRDRYESGFPVLKEIIQNADDAGSEKHPAYPFNWTSACLRAFGTPNTPCSKARPFTSSTMATSPNRTTGPFTPSD